jgi:hypothetical protein
LGDAPTILLPLPEDLRAEGRTLPPVLLRGSPDLRHRVVGERFWKHCAVGLVGRVRRRLPVLEAAVSRR